MTCVDPQIGNMIVRYEYGLLSNDEKKEFENHLLRCDYCFHELYNFAPVLEAIQDNKYYLRNVLEADLQKDEKKPFPWLKLVAALAPICLVLWLSIQVSRTSLPPHYPDLAMVQPPTYEHFEFRLRAFDWSHLEWQELFDRGMGYYSAAQYDSAIVFLRGSFVKNTDKIQTQYYLGHAYLAESKPDSAIHFLTAAQKSDTTTIRPDIHWALGNAFLLQNKPDEALKELQVVAATDNPNQEQALALVEQLEREINRSAFSKWLQQIKKIFVKTSKREAQHDSREEGNP